MPEAATRTLLSTSLRSEADSYFRFGGVLFALGLLELLAVLGGYAVCGSACGTPWPTWLRSPFLYVGAALIALGALYTAIALRRAMGAARRR